MFDYSSDKRKTKQNDEIITISSDGGTPLRVPATLSRNILKKLYDVECEELKDELLPQSEPKRRPTKDTVIRRPPRSERYKYIMCCHIILSRIIM